MDWKYILDKYTDKKDTKCPVLDAFVKKKMELKDYKKTEDYIQNWAKCHSVAIDSMTPEDWKKVWRNQYWHLFVSWFAMAHDANYEETVPAFYSTELWIWLYESQGLFKKKEKDIIAIIEKIDKLKGERPKWRKKIFEAAGFNEAPSWSDLKLRARWKEKSAYLDDLMNFMNIAPNLLDASDEKFKRFYEKLYRMDSDALDAFVRYYESKIPKSQLEFATNFNKTR